MSLCYCLVSFSVLPPTSHSLYVRITGTQASSPAGFGLATSRKILDSGVGAFAAQITIIMDRESSVEEDRRALKVRAFQVRERHDKPSLLFKTGGMVLNPSHRARCVLRAGPRARRHIGRRE